jgi:hypothetical protein
MLERNIIYLLIVNIKGPGIPGRSLMLVMSVAWLALLLLLLLLWEGRRRGLLARRRGRGSLLVLLLGLRMSSGLRLLIAIPCTLLALVPWCEVLDRLRNNAQF